jgi:hypothetical protein
MRKKPKNAQATCNLQGASDAEQNRKPASLGTVCYCGGPGGRPGLLPVCITCLRTSRYIGQVVARKTAGALYV